MGKLRWLCWKPEYAKFVYMDSWQQLSDDEVHMVRIRVYSVSGLQAAIEASVKEHERLRAEYAEAS